MSLFQCFVFHFSNFSLMHALGAHTIFYYLYKGHYSELSVALFIHPKLKQNVITRKIEITGNIYTYLHIRWKLGLTAALMRAVCGEAKGGDDLPVRLGKTF